MSNEKSSLKRPLTAIVKGAREDSISEMEILAEGSTAPAVLGEEVRRVLRTVEGATSERADFGHIAEHRSADSTYVFGALIRVKFEPPTTTAKARAIVDAVEAALNPKDED